MQVLQTRCAGLDVHKDTVVACVRCVSPPMHQEVRSFGTTTAELLKLADWLGEHDCTHVAMEAMGVYWKPVWHVLETEFELVLANAAHIRNVPGRKTDVNDAMWIADLLAHGLIRSSFVPPQAIQQLRDLTRTRKQLVREVSQHGLSYFPCNLVRLALKSCCPTSSFAYRHFWHRKQRDPDAGDKAELYARRHTQKTADQTLPHLR